MVLDCGASQIWELLGVRDAAMEAVLTAASRGVVHLAPKGTTWEPAQKLATKGRDLHNAAPFLAGKRAPELWHVEAPFRRPGRSGLLSGDDMASYFGSVIEGLPFTEAGVRCVHASAESRSRRGAQR